MSVSKIALLVSLAGHSTAQDNSEAFIDSFKTFDATKWHIAEYDFSHPHFDNDWRKAQVVFSDSDKTLNLKSPALTLSLNPRTDQSPVANRFLGGSLRRQDKTGFGRYESWIQPARGEGVVTGFFSYTGPTYGTRHDEIDIEFLGKNTRQLHVAWFVDGQLNNRFIDLGFDAAERFHHYRFDWFPDRIDWYVDGSLVFSVTSEEEELPTIPSRLFLNLWAADPSISQWSGKISPQQTAKSFFSAVKFTPMTVAPATNMTAATERTASKVSAFQQ